MRERGAGDLEALIMAVILSLGNEAYGVPIRNKVSEYQGRDISVGALYLTLSRLEEKDWVRSWTGEPTQVRGGRRKQYYELAGAGREALDKKLAGNELLRRIVAGEERGRSFGD